MSTLTKEQIQKAADNLANEIEDNSAVAQLLLKAESSCKSIGYTTAAARANRHLMLTMYDMYSIPPRLFSLTTDELNSSHVQIWVNAGKSMEMLYLDCYYEDCVQYFLSKRMCV